jgi:hypothetical protein
MRERLKRNICNLDDYIVLSEVQDLSTHQKDHIGDALEYACQFWTKHLLGVPSTSPYVKKCKGQLTSSSQHIFCIGLKSLSSQGILVLVFML